jgi:hypothetical protein
MLGACEVESQFSMSWLASTQSMIAEQMSKRLEYSPVSLRPSNSGSYCGPPMRPISWRPTSRAPNEERPALFKPILESSSTMRNSKPAPSRPRPEPCEASSPRLPKLAAPSASLNAPRIWPENSHTGICGALPPPSAASRKPAAARTVGSEAISRRDRFTALLAAYSALSASRSDMALANSVDISS